MDVPFGFFSSAAGRTTESAAMIGGASVARADERATATVVSWDSITSGSITFDLTSMVPETSSQLLATQEFEFGPGAEKTVLKQTIETQIEITAG